ncbi:replication licensing factor Cdt1, partial [Coemansia sp. 'formosensis']
SVVEPVIETAVEPVVEPTQSNTRDKLNERAAVLLARLRDRKKVAAETTAAETTAEETRTIQGDLRTRRAAAAAAAAPLPTQAVSTFAEAGGVSAPEQHQRDVHRQFVAIASPHGRALPRELRKLSEIFQALDHAVMFAGHASVIYHRTRRAVESMAKRTFGWRELGQILALYPESYHHAPVPTTHEGRRVASLELTPRVGGLDLAVEIEARRDEFARRLVARVDAAHRAFLAQRGYDANDIDATRGHWHPAFDVESTPKVTPLPLPPTPAAAAGPVATFDRERLRHLLDAAEAKNAESKEKPPAVLALPPTPADSPLLKPAALPKDVKVSPAKNLLERIREKQRAKEAAQLAAAQAIPPATRTMHSRLPAILETISFLFYTERRNVLPYFYVVDKLVESKGLERPDISNHIIALAGFVPEWCSITEPGNKDSGATAEPNDTPPSPPPVDPSPEARLNITRTISMRDAKARLIAKIEALNVE